MKRSVPALLGALVPLLVAGAYLHQAEQIPVLFFGDPLGPRAFPRLIAGILAFSTLLWLLEALVSGREEQERSPLLLPLAVMAWFALYIATLETLGFVLGSALFLMGLLAVFHPGRWAANIAIAVLTPLSAQLLFGHVLSVPLPAGLLPGV